MQFELCHWKTVAYCTCCALKMTLMTLQEHSVDWLPKIIWSSLCSNYTTSEHGYKAQMSLREVPRPGLNFTNAFTIIYRGDHPCTALPHFGSRPSQLAFGMRGEWPFPIEIQKCHLAPSGHVDLSQSYIAGEEQKPLVSNSCIIRKLLEFLRHSSHPYNVSSWERAPCSRIGFYPAPGTLITLPNQSLITARWKHCPWYFCWSYF